MKSKLLAGLALGFFAAASASAANVDGILDASYGAATAHVTYDAGAPNSNFGSPTQYTDHASYDVYMTTDSQYWYGFFQAASDAPIVGTFANLYFDLDPANANGSDIGFELAADHANFFIPGSTGPAAISGILTAVADGGKSFEVAIPFQYFNTKLDGFDYYAGHDVAGGPATLRLSQTFGYSVAGGASYGDNRLGSFVVPAGAVPEPATWGMMLLGFGLVGSTIRRRAAKAAIA